MSSEVTQRGKSRFRIWINNFDHAYPIATAAGVVFNPACDQVISRTRDGELLGGVLFTNYFHGGSICVHFAGFNKHWGCYRFIWMCFTYPFEQLLVKKMIATVPETNAQSLEVVRKLGFKEEARVSDVFHDGGMVVMTMRREDCRFLKPRRGGINGRR